MKVLRPGDSTTNKWRYVQPETGAVFTGFSYWQVRDSVFKHRAAMKLDTAAGWEERFQDELCQQNEQVPCNRGKNFKPSGKRSLTIDDLKRFMVTLSQQNGSFVDQDEAERRAAICSTCPKNQSVAGCWGCGGIVKSVTKYLGNKHTSRDKTLESC